jgi:hypothetical protein
MNRIILCILMGCLFIQTSAADDWKPEWTEAHPGWLTYKTNMLVIFYAPDSVLAKNKAIRAFVGKYVESYDNDLKALDLKDSRTIKIFVALPGLLGDFSLIGKHGLRISR